MNLPESIYQGDAKNILIKLEPGPYYKSSLASVFRNDEDIRLFNLSIERDISIEQFIEIELLAAGIKIHGDLKQRQNVNAQKLLYSWNCLFENSRHHEISFMMRLVSTSDTTPLGVIQHSIRVTKLDHLTQRQVWLIATLAAAVSSIFGVIQVLNKLGLKAAFLPLCHQ